MDTGLTWIVFAAGYVPMHFMVPLLLTFMSGDETEIQRKALLRYVLIEGALTLLMVWGAASLLWQDYRLAALVTLLIGPLIPLLGLWLYRRRKGNRWRSSG